jgi:hypothetical protein
MSEGPKEISLLDSLDHQEWIKLLVAAMQDSGPAAQTLGGLLKITPRETYVPVEDIAGKARLPIATVRKHLVTLNNAGWIDYQGRQPTRRGHLRRTATITIAKRTKAALVPYGFLPWWAACSISRVGRLPWCVRAVLSLVMARLCSLKAAVENSEGHGLDDDDVQGSIDNMGGDDRWRFSLACLMGQTGLTHDSVTKAKRLLNHHYGIVHWSGAPPTRGQDTPTDILCPNWDFRVIDTPASEGRCWLAFSREAKSGQ